MTPSYVDPTKLLHIAWILGIELPRLRRPEHYILRYVIDACLPPR